MNPDWAAAPCRRASTGGPSAVAAAQQQSLLRPDPAYQLHGGGVGSGGGGGGGVQRADATRRRPGDGMPGQRGGMFGASGQAQSKLFGGAGSGGGNKATGFRVGRTIFV